MTTIHLDEPRLLGFSIKESNEIARVRMVSRHDNEYHIKYFFDIPNSTLTLFLQLQPTIPSIFFLTLIKEESFPMGDIHRHCEFNEIRDFVFGKDKNEGEAQ